MSKAGAGFAYIGKGGKVREFFYSLWNRIPFTKKIIVYKGFSHINSETPEDTVYFLNEDDLKFNKLKGTTK